VADGEDFAVGGAGERALGVRGRIAIAALCAIVCALLASGLDRNDLIYGDEALYAISARNAREGVEFIANPSVKPLGPPGDKPFLYPLLLAASLGVDALGSVHGPRLATLVVFLASVPLSALLGRALWSPRTGAFALVLFAASPLLAHYGRWLRAEIPVTTAVVAAAWAITRAVRTERARWGFAAGAFLGLGFLCKLWLVAPGAAAIAGGLAAASIGAGRLRARGAAAIGLAALGGFFAVAPAQLVLCAFVSPETLSHWIYIYFGFSFAERLAGATYTDAWHQPWHYYFTQAGQMIGLILPLAALGAVAVVPRRGAARSRRLAAGLLFGWIALLVPLSIFSVKSGSYVLPILPAFFLLAAAGFSSLIAPGERRVSARSLRLAAILACVLCAASQLAGGLATLRPHSPIVAAVQAAWIALILAASFVERGAAMRWLRGGLAASLAATLAAGVARDAQVVRDASRDVGYAALARRLAPALDDVDPHEPCFIAPAFPALSYSLFKSGRYWSVPYASEEPEFARAALASERPVLLRPEPSPRGRVRRRSRLDARARNRGASASGAARWPGGAPRLRQRHASRPALGARIRLTGSRPPRGAAGGLQDAEVASRHFGRRRDFEEPEDRRGEIAQRTAGAERPRVPRPDEDARNGIRRVRGVRPARDGVDHKLAVAVVRGDDRGAADPLDRLEHASEARVDRLDRGDGGGDDPRVSDHIRVREVQDDRAELARVDLAHDPLRDLVRAHFRFEVVRRDLRRRNQDALLAGETRFLAAIEEVGHVRVLLRLRDPQVRDAAFAEHLPEHVDEPVHGEDDGKRELRRVGGHRRDAHVRDAAAGEAVERRLRKRLADLANAVRAEVEDEERVALFDARARRARLLLHHDRQDELVGLSRRIRILHGGDGIARRRPFAQHHRRPRLLRAIPAAIAVHRVVAADDRRDARALHSREARLERRDVIAS